jgi:hypothetical protein
MEMDSTRMANESTEEPQAVPAMGSTSSEKISVQGKTTATVDVEIATAEAPEKTYYSKLSVWLMVLFSGLAIGSDG